MNFSLVKKFVRESNKKIKQLNLMGYIRFADIVRIFN